ncbi:hypothetical protein A9R01_04415 ['Osedax' symbiont bacterium Rs2_46_30_T18]|nr:hypothetical protein A9R01_04415 ['Osedax' symbiont bacterium Rs2_46_30_T18]
MYLSSGQKGFTLVELMVAVSVTLLLLTVAVPSFNSTLINMRGSAVADSLVAALHFSRSEAISRNERIIICASADGATCVASTNWNSGWLVQRVADNSAIRYWEISTTGAVITNSINSITYNAAGDVLAAGTLTTSITNCSGLQQRQIAVALSGVMTVSRLAC